MKNVITLVTMILLAICCSAQGDILVYNGSRTTSYAQNDNPVDSMGTDKAKGYFILDVTYTNGEITAVNNAAYVEYGKDENGKWADVNLFDFTVERFESNDTVQYAFVVGENTMSGISMLIIHGQAVSQNIGNADPNEAPKKMNLNYMEYEADDSVNVTSGSLKINSSITKDANANNATIEEVYDSIREAIEDKGYTGLPADLPE